MAMRISLLLWMFVSLLSISQIGQPLWALGLGAVGGTGIGIWLWWETPRKTDALLMPLVDSLRMLTCMSFLAIPLVFILLFSKRLPTLIAFLSCMLLVILFIYYRRVTRKQATPVDFPIFLLLLISATASLYASPNPQLARGEVFGLVAGIAFFYFVMYWVHIMRFSLVLPGGLVEKFNACAIMFVLLGALCALGAFFVMIEPPMKLTVIGRLFSYVPDGWNRSVNPNYVGGMLVLFFPLSIWGVGMWDKWLVWVGLALSWIIAMGLLLAQSRGALLGAGVAMGLTMAYQYRWMRWIVLLAVICGVFLFAEVGGKVVLGLVNMTGSIATYEDRMEIWQRAIYIVQDFSFTGVGLRGFPVAIDLFYPLFVFGPDVRVPHAHNLFLQMAVDIGIPGFVAFWILLGAWGGMVWESLQRTAKFSRLAAFRPLVLGLSGGMVAHLIYGIMDTINLGEKAGVIFWVVLALTVALWQQVREGENSGILRGVKFLDHKLEPFKKYE
jgi:putative inorganic carbon (hco3(-)) transporter